MIYIYAKMEVTQVIIQIVDAHAQTHYVQMEVNLHPLTVVVIAFNALMENSQVIMQTVYAHV